MSLSREDLTAMEAALRSVRGRLVDASQIALTVLWGSRGGLQELTPEQFQAFTGAVRALDTLLLALGQPAPAEPGSRRRGTEPGGLGTDALGDPHAGENPA